MTDTQMVFGVHAVHQALQNLVDNQAVLYVAEKRQDQRIQAIIDIAQMKQVTIQRCARQQLSRYAKSERHQGVVLQMNLSQQPQWSESALLDKLADQQKPAFLLILDGVQDPHNLGACLRSADAAGVDAVILPKNRSVSVTPVVRKVACGAAETLPVVTVPNLARTLQSLQKAGVWVVGLDADTGASQPLYNLELTLPLALVMGNEGQGMRALTMKHCDFMGYLPMQGQVESLNVSVATGVSLFEVVRQRFG